jgi:multidrug efflux system membrane fusion protein
VTVKRVLSRLFGLMLAIAAVGVVYHVSTKEQIQKAFGRRGGGGSGGPAVEPPVPVTVAVARLANMPILLDGVGTARPAQSVTVRPQVEGRILKIHFREGQMVEKGALLAELDDSTWKAQLDQVSARRALTETQLANARRDLDRYQRIPGVVPQKTVDTQGAQVAQLEAQLKADDAAIAQARANLDFTRIHAPLTGRTGLRQVDEGNLIRASGDAGLVTISQLQPMAVMFTLPQQSLQVVKRAEARGEVPVEAIDADGKTVLDRGVLQVVDNQVEQTTGTVRMKAEFANAQMQLWPGQFVNVRLLVDTLTRVVVVPTPAVQRGPNGAFVYLVGETGAAKLQAVETQMQTETESVIKVGVAPGDRVVTTGFARLTDGSRLTILEGAAPGAGASAAPSGPAAAGAAVSGGDARARFERIRQACGGELQSHCAGQQREAMRQCLETNRTKFSPPCQAAIADQRPAGGKAAAVPAATGVTQ